MNLPCLSRFNDSQIVTSAGTTAWLHPSQRDPRSPNCLPSNHHFTLQQACDCTRHGCEPGPGGLSGGWGDRRKKPEQVGYLIAAPGDEDRETSRLGYFPDGWGAGFHDGGSYGTD